MTADSTLKKQTPTSGRTSSPPSSDHSKQKYDVNYDVIIVGAGPAGCSAAAFLAQQGHNILVLDKAVFPRDKVCGDGITGASLSVVKRMGAYDAIRALNPWNISHALLTSPSGETLKAFVPFDDGEIKSGVVIPRKTFDHALVEHLKTISNIEVQENTKITDLVFDGKRATGVTGHQGEKKVAFRGKYIIAADGAHSLLAKKLSLSNNVPKYKGFSVRAYFENVSQLENTIEVHYDTSTIPGFGWIFPTGPDTANVGVIVLNRFSKTKGLNKLFDDFIASNESAKSKLKNAKMVENSFKGWPLTYGTFPAPRSKGNVLLIGDSASLTDPFTSEGIFYSLKSGEFAADAINQVLTGGESGSNYNANYNGTGKYSAAKIYETHWRKAFKWKEFIPGYILQTIFNKGWLLDFSIRRAAKSEKKSAVLAGILGHRFTNSKLFFNI